MSLIVRRCVEHRITGVILATQLGKPHGGESSVGAVAELLTYRTA